MQQATAHHGSTASAQSAAGRLPAIGVFIILIGELEVVGLELLGLIRGSRQEPG